MYTKFFYVHLHHILTCIWLRRLIHISIFLMLPRSPTKHRRQVQYINKVVEAGDMDDELDPSCDDWEVSPANPKRDPFFRHQKGIITLEGRPDHGRGGQGFWPHIFELLSFSQYLSIQLRCLRSCNSRLNRLWNKLSTSLGSWRCDGSTVFFWRVAAEGFEEDEGDDTKK